jgi:hypothetical protein
MFALLLKAPGLFRTVSATLLAAAELADHVAPVLSSDLQSVAGITAIVGIVRATVRKFAKGKL